MKLEIDQDTKTYRLVDGVEGTASYQTGDIVDWGNRAELVRDKGPDAYADIDGNGCFDGLAHLADGTVEPIGIEFDCEFDEDEDDDTDEGADEEEEETAV